MINDLGKTSLTELCTDFGNTPFWRTQARAKTQAKRRIRQLRSTTRLRPKQQGLWPVPGVQPFHQIHQTSCGHADKLASLFKAEATARVIRIHFRQASPSIRPDRHRHFGSRRGRRGALIRGNRSVWYPFHGQSQKSAGCCNRQRRGLLLPH